MWIVLGIVAAIIMVSGYSLAKYAIKDTGDSVYIADTFYFSGDILKKAPMGGSYPTYTLREGVTSISLDLTNYADELRTSEVDISYEVNIRGEETGGTVYSKTIQGTVGKNVAEKDEITVTDLESGRYVITVSTEPYKEVLGAILVIRAADKPLTYTVNDKKESAVLEVEVTTNDNTAPITITWPASLLPDNTDPKLAGVINTNTCTVELPANSSYIFKFFKTNKTVNGVTYTLDTVYTIDDITVTAQSN